MIYVFKTTVETSEEVQALKMHLNSFIPNSQWNFDLEDCDNILRVSSTEVAAKQIIDFLDKFQFQCVELE